MQLLILNIKFSDVEAWLTLAAIPVSIVLIFLGVWSVRHEIHWLQLLFDFALVAGGAYFGFKLWRVWSDDTKDNYAIDRKSLTIFGKQNTLIATNGVSEHCACIISWYTCRLSHMSN